ncbi:MAG TPA: alpha/beta fold hydrolase [Steroidobacteraceae bacterium]|nr:alpha/beta fold hydrolase [Steroidobacteraceae bacterium]
MLWLTSRAALPVLKDASQLSNAAGQRLRALAAEIEAIGAEPVQRALDLEIARRAEAYLAGLEAYRRHPFRRRCTAPPVVWRQGTTRLLDYGRDGVGPTVLVIPSLINRYYVLDLLPERSFLLHLASFGLRPMVVDWGVPDGEERHFDVTDYIVGRLEGAFAAASRTAAAPIGIVGYCMGGLLALALALRRRSRVGCVALLATPWDFHAQSGQAQLLAPLVERLARVCGMVGVLPVEAIQTFFFLLDPFSAERKFTRFTALDPEGDDARRFVALEDWINDGVPLSLAVARECARSWYGDNEPGKGLWRVAGQVVRPQSLRRPVLAVVPGRDRIVPPSSAEPLAAAIGAATVLRPALGHIGMMSAVRAPEMLWTPLADWLRTQLGAC